MEKNIEINLFERNNTIYLIFKTVASPASPLDNANYAKFQMNFEQLLEFQNYFNTRIEWLKHICVNRIANSSGSASCRQDY